MPALGAAATIPNRYQSRCTPPLPITRVQRDLRVQPSPRDRRLLADAETAAHRAGHHEVSFGYQLDSFPMIFFADADVGQLDRYILFSPPFLA